VTRARTLYLCGAGNAEGVRLALVINRRQSRWNRILLLDDNPALTGMRKLGVEVAGPITDLLTVDPAEAEAVNLVARATRGRDAVRRRILVSGVPFTPLIGPEVDTEGVELAADVVVYPGASLGPESSLASGACVFTGAVVGHESRVGSCCVIAPNAVLNARVVVEEGVYVGANATILPELTIGAWATIGAGSTVLQDVPAGSTAIGVPAQILSALSAGEAGVEWPGAAAGSEDMAEELVAKVWCEVLRVPSVDRGRNFFDVGGTSLLAMQVRERIRRATGRELAVTDMFRYATVRALARQLLGSSGPASSPAERGLLRRAALLRGKRGSG
jgi:sugar O-acyltransferase (sialic acid O-acetyltransferase NeuD family)